jgi:hypothetical protein
VTCRSGKRRWSKRGGAHREAKRLTRMNRAEQSRSRGERRGAEVREYLCDECGGFHVMSDKDVSKRVRSVKREAGEQWAA